MVNRKASIRGGWAPGTALLLAATLFATCGQASGSEDERFTDRLMRMAGMVGYDFDGGFQVRGWKVLPKVYVGPTKLANEWGVGVLVRGEKYAWGINSERLSFIVRW